MARHGAWVIVIASAFFSAVLTFPGQVCVDDAFITFRYAENFATGSGLIYNAGEAHLGVTCPLYALLLGCLYSATGISLTSVSFLVHVAATVGYSTATYALLRKTPLRLVAVFAPWALLSIPAAGQTAGMESILFVALGFVCVLLSRGSERRRVCGGVLGALAACLCLIRPDGIFLVVILIVVRWRRERRFPLAPFVTGALILGGWAIFASIRYGGPVPDTVGAKAAQANTLLWPVGFFGAMWTGGLPAICLAYAALAVVGICRALATRHNEALIVATWMLLHNGTYAAFAVPPYPWYYVPLLGQIIFLASFAVGHTSYIPILASRKWLRPVAPTALGLGLAALTTLVVLRRDEVGATLSDLAGRGFEPKEHTYYRTGVWLNRHTPPAARVAAIEVGMIGYFSKRYIVDYLGLVTPGLSHRVRDMAHIDAAMHLFHPDYLVAKVDRQGQDANVDQYIVSDYFPVHAIDDCVILKRRAIRETDLARLAAEAVGTRRGKAAFGDFPRLLSFDEFSSAFRKLSPEFEVERYPSADTTFALQFDRRGDVVVKRLGSPTVHITAEDIRGWSIQEDHVEFNPSAELPWSVKETFGFVWCMVNLQGPVRRIRIRMRVDPRDSKRNAGAGRLWWEATAVPEGGGERATGWTTFSIPRVREYVDVAVDFHSGGPSSEQTLKLIRIDLFDSPARIAISDVWLDRG